MTEETIFTAALEKQTPTERSAFLDEACGADASLRQRIEILIACHERALEFLEKPAVEQIAAGIAQAKEHTGATDAIRPAEEGISATPVHARLGETQAEPAHEDEDGQSLDFLAPSERPDALGRIGHYHVLAVIGRGGMGVVLKAFDEELQRVVAIKVMTQQVAATGMARKRFRREAQAAAAVRDEHVITIHAVEEINGLPYLVMEYVSGISLQERLDQDGPLELKEILRIGMQTAAGLAKAHAQGLIHRDIKPANILLENGVQRVKITDFGLARAVDDASLTQSGVIAGTPQYMAPEQARGEAVDHRADLFSLGSVLYAMCTGHPPFRANTAMAVLKRVCEETPRAIREINPEIPDWLCAIIDKLHAKDPAQRFQSAQEVADLLGQHLAHLQQPALVPMPPRVERPFAGAATAARKPSLRLTVLMILAPFFLIPVAMALSLWSGSFPNLLFEMTVSVSGAMFLSGLLFAIFRSGRHEQEEAAPLPQVPKPPRVVVHVSAPPRTGSRAAVWVLVAVGLFFMLGFCCVLPAAWLLGFSYLKVSQESQEPVLEAIEGLPPAPAGGREFLQKGDAPRLIRQARLILRGNACTTPAVAFSPDKKTVATGDEQGFIFLWDVATGQKQDAFKAHDGLIWSLAFSPNGKHLASASWDRTVKVWTPEGGRKLPVVLRGHSDKVWAVAFSPDGKRLASASDDKTVRIWDPTTGKHWRMFKLQNHAHGVAYASTGNLFAHSDDDGKVRLWDPRDWKPLGSLEGHPYGVRLAFSPDGTTLACGGHDRAVILSDAAEKKKLATLRGFSYMIESVAFSPDGKLLATGGGNWKNWSQPGEVTLWDVVQRKKLAQFEGHTSCVHTVAFSPDGKTLATASHDGTVRLWDVPKDILAATAADRPAPSSTVLPFVILGRGKADRAFATLAEAVAATQWGDAIEVDGNGPFVSPPIFLRKALTIRAGTGFRPVIELNPAQVKGDNPLLESNAPLVLEGLQLRRIGKERYRSGPIPSMVVVREAPVRVTNCRFVAYPDCVALTAYWSPVCEVRNCEFFSRGIFGRVDHLLPHRGHLILDNNVMLGGDIGADFHYRQPDLADVAIELTRNTLVVQTPLCLFLDTPPTPRAPGTDATAKPIRLKAADNLLDGQVQVMELFQSTDFLARKQPLDAGSAQDLLGRLITWKEQNNVYPHSISLLAHFVKAREPLPAGKSLADWDRFWGVKDTAAVRGEIRYRGGDLHSRALIELEKVTAADFRLQANSPGKGVGGRDVGADVDLVGPGAAYERWKKTPDYQKWLTERK